MRNGQSLIAESLGMSKSLLMSSRGSKSGRGCLRSRDFTVLFSDFFEKALMEIKKVGILGCGLMGSGIAQVAAMAGFDTTVLEVEQKYLDKGFAGIEKSLSKFAERPPEKGGITAQQKKEIQARLKGTTKAADLADCDIVIEAIIENVPTKKEMYGALDGVVKKDSDFCVEHFVDFDY